MLRTAAVSSGMSALYRDLALGLALLYVVLFVITASVSRGLRREVAMNAFLAEHDTLTGLPNRTLFLKLARRAVRAGGRRRGGVAIAIADLDRFKEINDTLGHGNGDTLLTQLAKRLTLKLGANDSVARLGGDEFGFILKDVSDPEEALRLLREVINDEIEVSGLWLSVEASIGFALAPDDGSDVEALLQKADLAMYAAKAKHSGVMCYDSSLERYDAETLALVSELRSAIERDQLILRYQPQADLPARRVTTVEALVRWEHPEQGLLQPGRFLPAAEQTDVIDELTTWVLRRALTDIRDLPAPHRELRVAVNISARSLSRTAFAQQVVEILDQLGVEPSRLIVEVTETALLADPPRAAVLKALSDAGVGISLDDFGRGQTSIAYLSELPIDELKIDKSFVIGMLGDAPRAAIVRSIIELGHNLDLPVVAEGVETDDVLSVLVDWGCDTAQGFLLARPMPKDALQEWLSPPEPLLTAGSPAQGEPIGAGLGPAT